MKVADFRIKDIKYDRVDWINEIEPEIDCYKLNLKPSSRELMGKLIEYIKISKDFVYISEIKKTLDKISNKFGITIFEGMTDPEVEEYFEEFTKKDDLKREDGKVINNFFN
jgi:ribosomal protein S24E